MKAFLAEVLGTAALCAALGAALAIPAGGAENNPPPAPRPDATGQPIADGCQRNPVGLLTYTSPEWTYVYDYQHQYQPGVPRVAEGLVTNADSGTGDLPQSHNWYDFSTDVKVDPQYGYLLGGDPTVAPDATGAGNFADNPAILHVEWEEGTLPMWDWATAGDREKMWGRWVWDCGHWQEGLSANAGDQQQFLNSLTHDGDYFLPGTGMRLAGGTIRGEQTEFHPLQSVLITRATPTTPGVGQTETDAMISSDGTRASADSLCAHDHPAPTPANSPLSFYGPDWTACVNTAQNVNPVNTRDYTAFIPAPPRPSPTASLRFSTIDHNPSGRGPTELVTPASNGSGVFVDIPFQGFGSSSERLAYGKSLFVGWSGATQFVPAHIQVIFRQLTINNSLDQPGADTAAQYPPGEYNLYSNINGDWSLLNDYAPQIGAVNSGDVLNLNHTYEENVPSGSPVHIVVRGRECDLPRINPCANTNEVAEDNDDPGTSDVTFNSVNDAVGQHVLKPPGANPAWQLTYEVRLVRPATKAKITGGPGCVDVFPPKTHAARRKIRANRGHIALRGKVRERNCSSRRARARSVEVSIARRSGKLCRFLDARGKLGKPRGCRLRSYLPATAKGRKHWRFKRRWPGKPGLYVISTRATDAAGNIELPRRKNSFRLHLRRVGR